MKYSRTRSLRIDIRRQILNQLLLAALLTLAFLFVPHAAHAQTTLGSMMCDISFNLAPFEKLFVGLSYITGAILIGMGLMQLAFFTDTINAGRQFGVSRPKGYLIAGAALLALPAFIRLLVASLFGNFETADMGGGLNACVPTVGAGGAAGTVGLDGLVMNMVMNIKSPMVFMLSVISILIGIFLVAMALIKASKFGQNPKASVPNIIANLVIGTILYTVGTSLNTILATVFGTSAIAGPGVVVNAIAFDFGADTQPFQAAVYAALTFFQLVGMIAFIRGWLILKDAVEGHSQKTVAQGLTHIFGGVCAVNIYAFLQAMDTTFGTGFL